MRLISIENIEPHMKLAQPIMHNDCNFLSAGATNLGQYISKLKI